MQHPSPGHPTTGTGKRLNAARALDVANELASNFPVVARYLGGSHMQAVALEFYGGKVLGPSFNRSWFKKFPADLAHTARFKFHPEIAELAVLELGIRNAVATEYAVVKPSVEFESLGAERRKFRLHPSVRSLVFTQNTTSIWSALTCEENPPRPYKLDVPQHVLVWQQKGSSRFRILGEDEAKALAQFNTRAPQKSPYFRGWLEAGLVVEPAK